MFDQQAHSLVTHALSEIRRHRNDHINCMDIALEQADALFFRTRDPVDTLIQMLADRDQDTVLLAMMYLGLLCVLGNPDASRAIIPIRQAVTLASHEMLQLTARAVLSMLGDPGAIYGRDAFMRTVGIPTVQDFNSQAVATIVTHIRRAAS